MLWPQIEDWCGYQNGQELKEILLLGRCWGEAFSFIEGKWPWKCWESSEADRLLCVAQPLVSGFWPVLYQSLRVYQDVRLPRFRLRIDQKVFHLTFVCATLYETAGHNPLRSQAGKHFDEAKRQEWNRDSWLWVGVPWQRDCVYLHPVKILQSAWHHAGIVPLYITDRHVELWLHSDWALHRIPTVSGW